MIEILIITFNRSSSLHKTLLSIQKSQLSSLKTTVIDNCSTDLTEQTVAHFIESGKGNLRYIKNARNIGAGGNLMRAYELATEDYLWIICDDDDYAFQNFKDVPRILQELRPDLLIVGSPIAESPEKIFHGLTGKLLDAKSLINTKLTLLLTFLPSAIISRSKLQKCDFGLGYKLISTNFPQFFWISEAINNNWSLYVLPEAMVMRPNMHHGLDSDFVHMNGYIRGTGTINDARLAKKAQEQYYGKNILEYAIFISKKIVKDKISGRFEISQYIEQSLNANTQRKLINLTLLSVLLIPNIILRKIVLIFARKMKKNINN